MFLVKCPRCKRQMKCSPRVPVTKAVKNCVFCGYSFKIHSNLAKSRIVKKV